MDFKVKSSIAVDEATRVFKFLFTPDTNDYTNIIEKSKSHDIVGALGYMLTYHKALKGHCMASRWARNLVAWFFSRRRGNFY